MDGLLSRLGVQALNYAIKSGIVLTSNYAIGQCTRLLKTVDDRNTRLELERLQQQISTKVKIISSAISLIELKAGRGNPLLEGALPLARSLHNDIIRLGRRLEEVATAEEQLRLVATGPKEKSSLSVKLKDVITDMKALLAQIDQDTPTLQLAISVSGESLSTSLPSGISPSRLLQSSILLTMGDSQFSQNVSRPVQIGPAFTVTLYMLFLGHATGTCPYQDGGLGNNFSHSSGPFGRPTHGHPVGGAYGLDEGDRKPLWQEVMHKARIRLCRTPVSHIFDPIHGFVASREACLNATLPNDYKDNYAYHIEIIEDLDDSRAHNFNYEGSHQHFDTINQAGIRESIPVHEISKIFYTDTGKVLNIRADFEGDNNPVLLLKRELGAPRPSGNGGVIIEHSEGETKYKPGEILPNGPSQSYILRDETSPPNRVFQFPRHLDPEWIALEAFDSNDTSTVGSDPSDRNHDDHGHHEHYHMGEGSRGEGSFSRSNTFNYQASLDPQLIAQIKAISMHPIDDAKAEHHSRPTPLYSAPQDAVQSGQSDHLSVPFNHDDIPEGILSHSDHFDAWPGYKRLSVPDLHTKWVDNRHGHQPSSLPSSPFDAITTSLSLMEMLIRLASLQQFQQTNHLAIPDYMLTFFLEETSSTGLRGEASWKVRRAAKNRVGFDPYTDTPPKHRSTS